MEEKREQTERSEQASPCAAVLEAAAPAEAGAKKLRVLVAMDVYLPNVDGVVNVMRNHLLHFPDWVEATAVGPKAKYYTDTDPYPIIRYKGFHVPFLKTVDFGFPSRDKAFLQRVREMDLDIIHVHTPFGVCKALTKLAREKGIPIVATFHTNYRMVFKHIFWLPFIYEPYIRTLGRRYGRMDEMFAATGATEAQLRSFGYKGSCSIVPFGTSLKEPEDRMQYVRRANELYGLREDETVFCFVGRLVKSKRVQFTLKALRIVRDRGYSFKFLVGGIGNYERALRRKIKKLGLSDCVVMTGFLESEGLKTVYSARRPAALSLHSRQFRARQGGGGDVLHAGAVPARLQHRLRYDGYAQRDPCRKQGGGLRGQDRMGAHTPARACRDRAARARRAVFFVGGRRRHAGERISARDTGVQAKTRRRRRGKGLNAHARSMRKAAERLSEQHPAAAKNA